MQGVWWVATYVNFYVLYVLFAKRVNSLAAQNELEHVCVSLIKVCGSRSVLLVILQLLEKKRKKQSMDKRLYTNAYQRPPRYFA